MKSAVVCMPGFMHVWGESRSPCTLRVGDNIAVPQHSKPLARTHPEARGSELLINTLMKELKVIWDMELSGV